MAKKSSGSILAVVRIYKKGHRPDNFSERNLIYKLNKIKDNCLRIVKKGVYRWLIPYFEPLNSLIVAKFACLNYLSYNWLCAYDTF